MTTKSNHRDAPLIVTLLIFVGVVMYFAGQAAPNLTCPQPKIYVVGNAGPVTTEKPKDHSINAIIQRSIPR